MSIKINGKTVAGMGIPGLSPYQVAKAGGYTGTEDDFNRALADLPDAVESAQQAEINANTYTDEKIAAIPTPDVSGQIEAHNTDGEAHADIRQAIAQADWNQNDEAAPDYVNNRTHWAETENTPLVENVTLTFTDGNARIENTLLGLNYGEKYHVIWDGVEQILEVSEWGAGLPCLYGSNFEIIDLNNEYYEDDELRQELSVEIYAYAAEGEYETGTTTHTLSVYQPTETIHTLDPKYLPNFVVTFTYEGDNSYTCDKTPAEIKAAWDSGSSVVGVGSDNDKIYTLKWVTDSEATFVYFFEEYWQGLTIYEDGSVDMYEFHPLDNQGDYLYGPLTLYSDPDSEMQAATKQYVDAKVFTAVYGTTTFAEIKAAYDGGATVLCTRADNSVKYVLTGLTSTTAYFMGMGSSTNILYRVYVDTEWHAASFTPVSSTQMNTAIETAIGTAIGGSY